MTFPLIVLGRELGYTRTRQYYFEDQRGLDHFLGEGRQGVVLASAPDEYFGRRRMAKTLRVLQLLEDKPRALGKLGSLV
jgi:hypothetical protein